MNKIYMLLYSPALVDLIQVLTNEKPEIDFVYLLIAIVASFVGSGVRVAYESEKRKIATGRVVFIFICSLCVSYLVYEFTKVYEYTKVIGILSIIGGIISVDIIKFFIEDLPTLLKEVLRNRLIKDKKDDLD